jgi:protein-serine/threonine kinase
MMGPALRPLDLGRTNKEDVYDELETVIDEMKRWMDCVEGGLEELLKMPLAVAGQDGEEVL